MCQNPAPGANSGVMRGLQDAACYTELMTFWESRGDSGEFRLEGGTLNALIDSDGRIEIPDEIRRQAGLRPGMPVEVSWRDGRIEIEPRPTVVKLVRQGRLLVAVTDTEQAPLTADVVEETRRALEDEKAI